MGLIRVNNPRWFRLLKFLSGIFSLESTDNKTKGRYGGAAVLFTREQAEEIAAKAGYKQGYIKIHSAMWQKGLTDWQKIADLLNENGQGPFVLTGIRAIGKATAIEIVHFGFTKDFLWFED